MFKLFVNTTVFCMTLLMSQGLMATEFKEIMKLMEKKAEISLEFIHGHRPMKAYKEGDNWILEQLIDSETSIIKDEGDNKISVGGFPLHWSINGTWAFSKNGSQCNLTHTSEVDHLMSWKC